MVGRREAFCGLQPANLAVPQPLSLERLESAGCRCHTVVTELVTCFTRPSDAE